jgi:TPR repeat protein
VFLGIAFIVMLGAQSQLPAQTPAQTPAQPRFQDGLLAYHRGDHTVAMDIWRPLAERGDASAQYMVGYLYAQGEGVQSSSRSAAKWYRKAADQGDPDAQLNLGLMYVNGTGVTKSYVSSYKWFALAYLTYPPGEYQENAFRNRENVATLMSAEQIEKAKRLVRRWKPKNR